MNSAAKNLILLGAAGAIAVLSSRLAGAFVRGDAALGDVLPGFNPDRLDALNNALGDFDSTDFGLGLFEPAGDVQAPDLSEPDLDALFIKHGRAVGLDPELLKAVAIVESSLDPSAVSGAGALGVMQILTPARRYGIAGWDGTQPVGGAGRLFDPDFNIWIGAQILKWNIDNFGTDAGIAAYNRWKSRNEQPGQFTNQAYVDKVMKHYALQLSA